MKPKFKIGYRVRVTKIDDKDFYGIATYKVGDVGTIIYSSKYKGLNYYRIEFDRLKNNSGIYDW